MKKRIGLITLLFAAWTGLGSADVTVQRNQPESGMIAPLSRAHAHNDYEHPRPLFDALSNGFTSVEADIYLTPEGLMVAHEQKDIRAGRTLERLYLQPLRQRVERWGSVYPAGGRFTLLVDVKTDAEGTYKALHDMLESYSFMLTRIENRRVTTGAVEVIVSGSRPRHRMEQQTTRYAGYDGRKADLESDAPVHFMPLISEHFNRVCVWRGAGEISGSDREAVRSFVKKAHAKGRRVRFWATYDAPTPERERLWRMLLEEGVDHINTDDLTGLRRYLARESRDM